MARWILIVSGVAVAVQPAALAQTPDSSLDRERRDAVLSVAVDTSSLGTGPFSEMSMLLEKTLFQVDVLRLRVRVGPRTASELRNAAVEAPGDATGRQATAAIEAQDVWAEIYFERNVSLRQFLNGVRDDLRRAESAGIIEPRHYQLVSNGLPRWYSFLMERGVRKGDRMFYRVVGDTLRTIYVTVEGTLELDQVDVGPERRLALLGSWFAPGSSFRRKLLRSLESEG